MAPKKIVNIIYFDPAWAVKITLVGPVVSGSMGGRTSTAGSSMRRSWVSGSRCRRIGELRFMNDLFRLVLCPALIAVLVLPAWVIRPDSASAGEPSPAASPTGKAAPGPAPSPTRPSTPIYTCRIVNTYPHDPQAFTQGLVFDDGILYEGTGLLGHSSVRKVGLKTGAVLQIQRLPAQLFGEGITVFGDRLIQLTWQSGVGLVSDKQSFRLVKEFRYNGEGWGLTHDGKRLIMSDGTATLRFFHPETYGEV